MAKATPTMEDYIEVIYSLVKTKGYARSADIAEKLEVYPSTVTKMLKKLDAEGYIVYEKYRGIALTDIGKKMGEYALTRHELLEEFLLLIGVDKDKIYEEVEGIEHHFGRSSLEKIKERISKNQLVFDVEELKEQYQESKEKTANDFELKLEVESWQVEQESKQGIYVQMDMGALNSGTILIPSHKVDKNEDGNYTIYIKEKDYFYFLNPDQSQKNRYMMGLTIARQLAKQNGETLVTKNAQISSMRELIKEYNFLVEHGVTDGAQFQHLEERFNEKIEATQEELRQLDERLGRYHKIEGALLAIQQSPENSLAAVQLLDDLGVPKDMGLEDVSQLIKQFQIEKGALQEFFDDTLKHYTDYRDIKEHVRSREEKVDRRFEDEKTL